MEKKNVVFLTVLAIATLLTAVVGTTFAYFTATVTNKTTPTTTTVTTANAVSVEYDDGARINLPAAVPGAYATKTFKVKNLNATDPVTYSISFDSTGFSNTFVYNGVCSDASITDSAECTSPNQWTVLPDLVYSLTKNGTEVFSSAQISTKVFSGATAPTNRAYSASNGTAQIGSSGTAAYVQAMPKAAGTLVGNTELAGGATDTYVLTVYFLETGIAQNENANGKTFTGTLKTDLHTVEGVRVETTTANSGD